jgi:uncharacterized protein with von Willebrand factor type A (vWA) domain
MRFDYSEFSGDAPRHLAPDELFPQPQVMNFILQYGDDALDALEQMDGDEEQDFVQAMIDAGLLEEVDDGQGGKQLRLTGKMVRGLQHRSLLDIFAGMRKGVKESHRTPDRGRTMERSDGNQPYQFGDPLSEIDLVATLRNAIASQSRQAANTGRAAGAPMLPIRLSHDDLELYQTEGSADCATVLLMDMSGSMYRYGRFLQAKRVALGMAEMIRQRFPQDTIDYVSFHTLAEVVAERDVPLVMPQPVSIRDPSVRLRLPLDQADAHRDRLPMHFTNLHLGLRTARQILARRGAANKQIFVITDGQPTAHIEPAEGTGEDMLYLLYPPSERSAAATLTEAMKCQQQGIRIASFAMIEDYWGMDWVGFIDRLTKLTRGMAYYCTSEDLSSTVIESYMTGKKTKQFIH